MSHIEHQYVDRVTGNVVREHLLANSMIRALYSPALEKAPLLTRMASSRYFSRVLGYLNYDNVLSSRATGMLKFLRQSGIQLSEFVGNLSEYDTARKIFERQIRYWNCRPMPANPRADINIPSRRSCATAWLMARTDHPSCRAMNSCGITIQRSPSLH